MRRWIYLSTTLLVTAAAPSFAQQPVQATTAPADIIVTAERRSVSVQKVPIAISAFNADQLIKAGVSNPQSLNKLVSGLDFRGNVGPGGSAIYIRGVGATPSNGLADQANAFSVDGIFFSRPVGPDSTFFDLQRVEVLKGPQGTLYGRNATAGAVNVITAKPELGHWGGVARLTLGNYAAHQAEAALNVPIGNTLALRFAGNLIGHNGYLRDGYNDEDTAAGRMHLYWAPSTAVNLLVTLYGAQERGKGEGTLPVGPNPAVGLDTRFIGDPWDGPTSSAIDQYIRARGATLVNGAPLNPTATGPGDNGRVHNDIWGVSGTLNVDIGPATWTTLAGYRDVKSDNIAYVQWDGLYTLFDTKETTVETRLSSSDNGPFKWIVGAFYGNEKMSNQAWGESVSGQAPAHPFVPPSSDPDYVFLNLPHIHNDSWAGFGELTFSLTPRLRVTGGARYTRDRKRLGNGTFGFVDNPYETTPFPDLVIAPPVPPFFPGIIVPGAFVPVSGSKTFDAVTYNGGLEFDAAPDSLLYANVRKGYHAGGLIASDPVGPYQTSYKSEKLMAYSVGTKNRFFDRKLTINAEAYYWDYRNLQMPTIGYVNCSSCLATPFTPAGATLGQITTNAGKAHTYGLDLDGLWRVTRADTLSLNLLWARGKYDRYSVVSPVVGTVVADGHDLSSLPHLTFTAGYQHDFALANGGTLSASGRTRYVGKRDFGVVDYPGSRQRSYTSSDIELTYLSPDRHFQATAFVRNLENGTEFVSSSAVTPEAVSGVDWGLLAPPRTFGGTLAVNF